MAARRLLRAVNTTIPPIAGSTRSPLPALNAGRTTSCAMATSVVDGDEAAIRRAVELLTAGSIVAIKGLGGYHLACDARNADRRQARYASANTAKKNRSR